MSDNNHSPYAERTLTHLKKRGLTPPPGHSSRRPRTPTILNGLRGCFGGLCGRRKPKTAKTARGGKRSTRKK